MHILRQRLKKHRFLLATGVQVANMDGVVEGFSLQQTSRGYSTITINISADRLRKVYLGLVALVTTPGYAIIELPTPKEIEDSLNAGSPFEFHHDVYYSNVIPFRYYKSLFNQYSRFFIEDGLICFGYKSSNKMDEVFVGRYKVANIFTYAPDKYVSFLEANGYPRFEKLMTVWDKFTEDEPGKTSQVTFDGHNVYDLLKILRHSVFEFSNWRIV
jgi:hypothetical protein